MDIATTTQGGETETDQRKNIMKTFEKSASIDTFLSAGLLAVGMAWVALAAAQAPETRNIARALPAYVDTVTAGTLHAREHGSGVSSATVSQAYSLLFRRAA
jgi:hypothetical protein